MKGTDMKKSLFATVAAFLGKYADEAEATGNVLEGIVAALPVNAQTRATLVEQINRLTSARANIRDWLENATDPGTGGGAVDPAALDKAVAAYLAKNPPKAPPVKIDKADINAAVAAYLKANPPAAPVAKASGE